MPSPSTSRAPSRPPRFYFVNVVWGDAYVRLFTQYSIPTLLAPGNIPGLANLDVSEFLVVTTEEDAQRIRESAVFPLLSSFIQVTFLPMVVTGEDKYDQMKRGHALATNYVGQRGYCIYLAPDAVVSDGMLRRLLDLAVQGRRVVAGFGPRVNQDKFIDNLSRLPCFEIGQPLSLDPRLVVELMMKHLHPDTLNQFVDSAFFPENPDACIWPAPNGILVRALNLHPYLFDTSLIPDGEEFDWRHLTVDWSVIPRYVTDWNELYVEKDSDNFCILGLTPPGNRSKFDVPNRLDRQALSLWILRHKHQIMNRNSLLYPIAFHASSLNEEWEALVERSNDFSVQIVDPAASLRYLTLLGHEFSSRSTITKKPPKRPQWKPLTMRVDTSTAADTRPKTGPADPIPFFYGLVVWGERYVDYLCRFALPSMLSPRNLPALANNAVSSLIIATTPVDELRIRADPVFAALSGVIQVEFAYLPQKDGYSDLPTVENHEGKYNLLSVGHSITATRATGHGYAVFLGPDAIYSDGMFSRLYELAVAGKEAVVGMGPRVNEETIVPDLVRQGLLPDDGPLTLPPRRGAEFLLRHLHEDARVLRWSSPLFGTPPYMCIWDIGGGDGVLLRCFSLHPYMVDYRRLIGHRALPKDTSAVDASFIINCLIPWNKIYQVTDSDEFLVLSLTSMHHRDYQGAANNNPLASLVASSRRHDMSSLHHAYFMNAIKIHTGDLDERWEQLERETLKLAYDILWPASHRQPPPSGNDLSDISGKQAARIVARKLMRRLRLRRQ